VFLLNHEYAKVRKQEKLSVYVRILSRFRTFALSRFDDFELRRCRAGWSTYKRLCEFASARLAGMLPVAHNTDETVDNGS
jgi:hypothetical protein